jgi:phosphonate transport system substrate-binding protein
MSDRDRTGEGRTGCTSGQGRNNTGNTGVSRRRYLTLGGATVATLATAGCSGGSEGGAADDGDSSDGNSGSVDGTPTGTTRSYDPVEFIETPGNEPENTRKQWKPFTEYLKQEVDGLEMEISFAQSYSAVGQALINGQGHITTGDVVVLANPDKFNVIGIRSTGGSKVYFSFIATLPTYDGVEELTDLKGTTVAFADRLSTSGSLFATHTLMEAGLDIGDAPYGDPVDYEGEWSNHDAAKKSLFNREDVVGIGTYAGNIIDHIPREQIPDIVRERSSEWGENVGTKSPEAEMLHASEPIPKEPIIMPSDWEHPLRDDIEQAILDIEPGTLREPEGLDLPITDVEQGSIEDFEPVREVIDELGVDLGDL